MMRLTVPERTPLVVTFEVPAEYEETLKLALICIDRRNREHGLGETLPGLIIHLVHRWVCEVCFGDDADDLNGAARDRVTGELPRDLISSTGGVPVAAVPRPGSTAATEGGPRADPSAGPENPWLGSLAEQYASVLRVVVHSMGRPTRPPSGATGPIAECHARVVPSGRIG